MNKFDEAVMKKCERLTPQEQARTGYYTKTQFKKSYDGLYKNIEVQKKFGVKELAFSKAPIFEQLSAGSIHSLEPSFEPDIIESKTRQKAFDESGKPIPFAPEDRDLAHELDEAKKRIEFLENTERKVMIAREEQALQMAEDENIKRQLAQGLNMGQLKDAYQDFLNAMEFTTLERQGAGLISLSDFQKLSREERLDYVVEVYGGAENLADSVGLETSQE